MHVEPTRPPVESPRSSAELADAAAPASRPRTRRWLWIWVPVSLLSLYLFAAYVVAPFGWERYAERHPSFDDNPRITTTGDDHPGDPLNVALIGSEAALKESMRAAGWFPASALNLKDDLKIAVDVALSRPDDDAPVSDLYLFGRKEDLAFEQPVGGNPRQRRHVRFWKAPQGGGAEAPLWLGSASYDKCVGLSETTGQVTHRIAPDVDRERDRLFQNLEATGLLAKQESIPAYHTQLTGRNGGGDLWRTDGALKLGVLKPTSPARNPAAVHE